MCDRIPKTLISNAGFGTPKLGFAKFDSNSAISPFLMVKIRFFRDGTWQFSKSCSERIGNKLNPLLHMNHMFPGRLRAFGSSGFGFSTELGFKGRKDEHFEFDGCESDQKFGECTSGNGRDMSNGAEEERGRCDYDIIDMNGRMQDEKMGVQGKGSFKGKDLIGIENGDSGILNDEEPMHLKGRLDLRSGRQLIKRSNMLAKQVISIHSALNLGFISQLWVDTGTWVVLMVELRPDLLSTESEKVLLEDIKQVGDVVLIQDESVLVDELRLVGLETLVGYEVVTPGRRSMGKVRGYTFDINSGAVESLELDSFGISIIPSSLVSTYALFIEDVIEVVSDTVIVQEAAATRIQRLTKGFWGHRNMGRPSAGLRYSDGKQEPLKPVRGQKARGNSWSRKFGPETRQMQEDWELPMDYL
ncbi:hypothetical protein Nepgr_024970 [Nepenthes gracilis]|uniref:PRC-barrel domain-containing protein n=1 Tax=Nepenthes gracilis TaxID=150966 RepID=A0AAD3XZ43_NEPGR|nr:hypothetical protein Nepgr_024970 [Nepenthes gracilis]